MTESEGNSESLIDWAARLDRVRDENFKLFAFVHGGERAGIVSKEASRAFFRTSVGVMARAGIIAPAMSGGGVSDAVMCTVVAQALHEGRAALLKVQPELKAALERDVPSTYGGRTY